MSGWTDWEAAEIWGEFTGLISLPYSPAPHSIIPTEPKQLALLVYYGRLHSKCSRISPCGSRIDLGRALFTVQILFACFLAAGFMKRWKERKPFFIIFFFLPSASFVTRRLLGVRFRVSHCGRLSQRVTTSKSGESIFIFNEKGLWVNINASQPHGHWVIRVLRAAYCANQRATQRRWVWLKCCKSDFKGRKKQKLTKWNNC